MSLSLALTLALELVLAVQVLIEEDDNLDGDGSSSLPFPMVILFFLLKSEIEKLRNSVFDTKNMTIKRGVLSIAVYCFQLTNKGDYIHFSSFKELKN